jgi:NAD(P)H dehydrogenase (quinone)
MQKVLIISGHPNLEASFANKAILEQTIKLFPDVEVSRLDLLYPDFKIDINAEQQKLTNADIII